MADSLPIHNAEIRTLIPHSGSMCLLDSVTQWDDRSIVCVTNTHRDQLTRCVAPGGYQPFMPSNTAHKRRQCTADCERAQQARPRHPATWLRCEMRVCTRTAWMISTGRLRFSRAACSATALIRFMNAVSRPAILSSRRDELQSCSAICQTLGSARVPWAGERVLAIAELFFGLRYHRGSNVQGKPVSARRRNQHARRTSHHDSAIDAEHLACDVGCFRRCKECHRVGNFFGRCGPSVRNFTMNCFLDILGTSGDHLRGDKSWRHCIDSNVAARQLARERLCEPDQACFARGVICLPGVTHQTNYRADVDNAAAALFRHGANNRLGKPKRAA